MEASQYGHIIKHLETHHLDALPVVLPRSDAVFDHCNVSAQRIVSLRNQAAECIRHAEEEFEARRFDAWSHNIESASIEERLSRRCLQWSSLRDTGCEIWLPNRFKRIPAEDGVVLVDSSQIFELNPDYSRRIAPSGIADRNGGHVQPGWLMMSRSGQVYGLLGSVTMATEQHVDKIISDDVIRIRAGSAILPGYLYVALSHATLGRPRVKAMAYGSSIPHIEPEDLREFSVPRLDVGTEQKIAGLADRAFRCWSEADGIENELSALAEQHINDFLKSTA